MVPLCFAHTSRDAPHRLRSASRLKSLSDVTVAPVAPTELSAHCSQNELHAGYYDCLAPTGNSLTFFSRLLFLLKRIWDLKLCCYVSRKLSICQALLSIEFIFFVRTTPFSSYFQNYFKKQVCLTVIVRICLQINSKEKIEKSA